MITELIVIVCLLLLLILGLVMGRKNYKETQTFADFFIGKKNFSTLIILSALFVGMVNGSSFINITAAVFSKGYVYLIPFLGIFLGHLWTGLWVAKKMGPYLECLSPGDILQKMYGNKEIKIIMGFTGLFESIFLISVQIMVLSFICHYFFALPHIFSACGTLLFTLIYSLRGGIKALIMSNILQFALLIIVLPVICCTILASLGSFDSVLLVFNNHAYKSQQIFDPYQSIAAFLYHALPAIFPLALQRMLMAKNVHQIKKTFIAIAFINFIFLACILIIGLYAYVRIPEAEPRTALLGVINAMMPMVKGLVIFALLAMLVSTINAYLSIASVAITQDLFLPLFKKTLKNTEKLKIAKLLLVGIGIFATILSITWNSIPLTVYFVIYINSSIMLAIYMLGFLGFSPSKKGLLYSIGAAITFLCIAFFIIDMEKVYAGFLAIAITSMGIIASHYFNKTRSNKRYRIPLFNKKFKLFDMSIKRIEYCTIFASIAIINAAYPFFLMIPSFSLVQMPFFLIYSVTSILGLLIWFKEIWPSMLLKYFPFVWHMLLMLSLPGLAFLMYFQSNFNIIWLIDVVITIVLLSIITKPNMTIVTSVSGAIFGVVLTLFIGRNFSEYVVNIGQISLIMHLISTIVCLLFFKKLEKELYQSVSSKITHEAARSLSGIGLAAFLLKERMGTLIYGYKLARGDTLLSKQLVPDLISDEELEELQQLPFNLNAMSEKTGNTLNSLLHKIDKELLGSEKRFETADIISLTKEAVLYPSFSFEQRKKIIINTYHTFFLTVVTSEILHVLVNLIENALNAISDKEDGVIEIWASEGSLFIKDNGKGIDDQIMYQIFDEGFSTKGTSGQGLAFCKKVMEEHAGRIRCTSKKGSYTKFELKFEDSKETSFYD